MRSCSVAVCQAMCAAGLIQPQKVSKCAFTNGNLVYLTVSARESSDVGENEYVHIGRGISSSMRFMIIDVMFSIKLNPVI